MLSNRQTLFGVHSATILKQDTFEPIKTMKIIGDMSLPFEAEFEDLMGGSSRFPWESEAKDFKSEASILLREWPDELAQYFVGASVTTNAAETGGGVVAIANKKGTSCVSATTGIATVAVKTASKAELKAGFYVVKVTGAAAVDVYGTTDVDFGAGTNLNFIDETLKITSSALTITTGAATEIPGIGVELTGGSGTIGMTTGDTAYFEIRPINVGSSIITIGSAATEFEKVACVFSAQKKSSGEVFYVWAPKCQGAGFPLSLKEKGWSEGNAKIKLLYDSTLDLVAKVTRIKRTL